MIIVTFAKFQAVNLIVGGQTRLYMNYILKIIPVVHIISWFEKKRHFPNRQLPKFVLAVVLDS